jgi:hypothetical protein
VLSGVGNFFGVEGDPDGGTCQPTCDPACPEHYHCTGRLCAADPDWADPIPTVSWSGAAEGTLSGAGRTTTVKLERGNTVTLTATAQSPVDVAVTKFAWNIVGDSGERSMLEAMSVDVTLDSDSYRRVELSVGDAEARSAELTVILESCSGPGTACGYQGSGCCNECDAQNKFCL